MLSTDSSHDLTFSTPGDSGLVVGTGREKMYSFGSEPTRPTYVRQDRKESSDDCEESAERDALMIARFSKSLGCCGPSVESVK